MDERRDFTRGLTTTWPQALAIALHLASGRSHTYRQTKCRVGRSANGWQVTPVG